MSKESKGFNLKNTAKSLRKKANQVGYKAVNRLGYGLGRVATSSSKTAGAIRAVASKIPNEAYPQLKLGIRGQAAATKGLVQGINKSAQRYTEKTNRQKTRSDKGKPRGKYQVSSKKMK